MWCPCNLLSQYGSYTIANGVRTMWLRDFRPLAEFILSDAEGLGVTF